MTVFHVELDDIGIAARAISCTVPAGAPRSYYLLSAGGRLTDPEWPRRPWNAKRQSDCSAFALWAAGFCRDEGDWNTQKVLTDAWRIDYVTKKLLGPGPRTRFEPWPRDLPVAPGCVLVYPGTYERIAHPTVAGRTLLKRKRPGHIAIGVEVLPGFVRGADGWWTKLLAAHSSPRNGRAHGSAIAITDASLWAPEPVGHGGYLLRVVH